MALQYPGISIDVQFPSKNKQREVLENKVKDLISNGIDSDLITLLSPKRFENTLFSRFRNYFRAKEKGIANFLQFILIKV
ncbi:MAG: hypothetical protein U5K00_22545 [Melioribacteraceae bacterium]|nr:hypothetical protein [Melioribacteraceae bacterium]